MSESDQRGKVVKGLREYDAVSVENRAYPGTPDVNYIGGWIELKWLRRWPKGWWDNVVAIDHFTPQQRVWLKRRWRRGGRAFLLLQAQQLNWFLFDGETAAQKVGRCTGEDLHKFALKTWTKGLDMKELKQWLKMDLPHLHEARSSLFSGDGSDTPSP